LEKQQQEQTKNVIGNDNHTGETENIESSEQTEFLKAREKLP